MYEKCDCKKFLPRAPTSAASRHLIILVMFMANKELIYLILKNISSLSLSADTIRATP